jgi:hypothetical protein
MSDTRDPRTDGAHEALLVSRIVGGEANEGDWKEAARLASVDPSLWGRIVEMQRDQEALERLMDSAGRVADGVVPRIDEDRDARPLPLRSPPVRAANVPHRPFGLGRLTGGLGWAVAALLFLAWKTGIADRVDAPINGTAPSAPQAAQIIPVSTASEALQAYLDKGKAEDLVIQEMPRKVLLETRPHASGQGIELIYIRQVMERTVVPDLYQLSGQDEQGRPALVRYQPPVRGKM